jgi:processive 1,2-diacylglycerol beta-glucosyltransferase
MVIVNPIPGQEERNADYLLEEGAAVRCNDLATVDYKIGRLLAEQGRVERMRANARRIGRPDAAAVIAKTALGNFQAPAKFDWRAQQAALRPKYPVAPPRLGWSDAGQMVALYDDARGVYLGTLADAEFRQLRRALPDYDSRAGTATVDLPEVERLRQIEGGAALADVLARRIGRYGPLRVRRGKVAPPPTE